MKSLLSLLKTIKAATWFIFAGRKSYATLAVISGLLLAALYSYAAQIITLFADGVYVELNLIKILAIAITSVLFGVVIAMQTYGMRAALLKTKDSGTTIFGTLTGMLSMSCCAPVLPALLILFGFSGTFILSLNTKVQKYFILLAAISIMLLLTSLSIMARRIVEGCRIKA